MEVELINEEFCDALSHSFFFLSLSFSNDAFGMYLENAFVSIKAQQMYKKMFFAFICTEVFACCIILYQYVHLQQETD